MTAHDSKRSPLGWPHALAWLLACAVFPLISIGGLVTTYEAGMSVPDWPTTYDHWFYPIQSWLYGVWDMFLEHGHRMWAQGVGLVALLAAGAIVLKDTRRWMRWVAAAILVGVAIQATLGGLRVLCDERLLAKVHAAVATAYFALSAATVSMTSRRWLTADSVVCPGTRRQQRLAVLTAALLYLDVILGVQLRHAPAADEDPAWFMLWLWLKLIVAGLATLSAVWLLGASRSLPGDCPDFRPTARSDGSKMGLSPLSPAMVQRRARWLVALVVVQLILGAATWLVNYGVPAWFQNYLWPIQYTVTAEGAWQVTLTTAHVAVGSLMLVSAVGVALWSYRLLRSESALPEDGP